MQEALNYFYYFFDKGVTLIFTDLEYFQGVTLGWICAVCFVFAILLHSIIALPSKSPNTHVAPRQEKNNG